MLKKQTACVLLVCLKSIASLHAFGFKLQGFAAEGLAVPKNTTGADLKPNGGEDNTFTTLQLHDIRVNRNAQER